MPVSVPFTPKAPSSSHSHSCCCDMTETSHGVTGYERLESKLKFQPLPVDPGPMLLGLFGILIFILAMSAISLAVSPFSVDRKYNDPSRRRPLP